MIYRLRHALKRLIDPTRRPLPPADLVQRLLKQQPLPKLEGDKLFVITDTSYKHDHTYDALVCTDENGMHRWNVRRRYIRSRYPQIPSLHYKKLKGVEYQWEAVRSYLDAINEMKGIAAVVATPKAWVKTDSMLVRQAKATGMSRTHHAWSKEHVYVGLVNLASLVATVARPFVKRGMTVHWFSDTEPPFRNPMMRKDINNAYLHALDLGIPVRHDGSSLIVKEDLPSTDNWKGDLFALPDMLAGGVGDAINALIEEPNVDKMTWDPEERKDLTQREILVADWFWGQNSVGPIRIGVKFEERGFDGAKLHRRANWFKPPHQSNSMSNG